VLSPRVGLQGDLDPEHTVCEIVAPVGVELALQLLELA
jgi:hypothetical protein